MVGGVGWAGGPVGKYGVAKILSDIVKIFAFKPLVSVSIAAILASSYCI